MLKCEQMVAFPYKTKGQRRPEIETQREREREREREGEREREREREGERQTNRETERDEAAIFYCKRFLFFQLATLNSIQPKLPLF